MAGLWLRRSAAANGGGHGGAVAAMLALAVLGAAPLASFPPAGATTVLVLFRPGLGLEGAFAAVADADSRVVRADASGELVAVQFGPKGSVWRLYRHGALLVGTSGPLAGCLAWTKV